MVYEHTGNDNTEKYQENVFCFKLHFTIRIKIVCMAAAVLGYALSSSKPNGRRPPPGATSISHSIVDKVNILKRCLLIKWMWMVS